MADSLHFGGGIDIVSMMVNGRIKEEYVKKAMQVAVIVVAVLAVGACTTFQLSGIQVVEDMPGMSPIGDFEIKLPVHEFLGGSGGTNLFNVTATNMDNEIYDAIRREVERRSGDAAINVTVRYEASFVNLLLNGITFGLYAPATAHVSGTVVSYN